MAIKTAQMIYPRNMIYPAEQIAVRPEQYPTGEIFARNLAVLQKTDPNLAQILHQTQLPDCYTLDICSDGAFSYRIIQQDQTSQWLGKRSAALLAAQADITRLELGQSNAAINGFGDGYTIKQAIAGFLPYQAIFVIEKDINIIKANLNIHDFSEPLLNRQLIIIHGQEPFRELELFLENNFGFQMIEKSVYVHRLSEQENNQFNLQITAAVEKSLNKIIQLHQSTAHKLQDIYSEKSHSAQPKLTTISNLPSGNNPNDNIIARDILAGFAGCQLQTHFNSFSHPQLASILAQTCRLTDQKPDAVLMVNSLRKMANYPLPGSLPVVSILPQLTEELACELAEDSTETNDIIVCPAKCLGSFKHQRLNNQAIALDHYVNPDIYHKLPPEEVIEALKTLPIHNISPVIMLCGRNPLDLEDYNIKLGSHINLISSACDIITDNPASYNSSLAATYFEKAAKKNAAKISDQETKDKLLQIFRQIADSLIQDIYGHNLLKEGIRLSIFSLRQYLKNTVQPITDTPHEWKDSPLVHTLAANVCDSTELNLILNIAKIAVFTHNDGTITRSMLNAAYAGALVLTKAHPKDSRTDGLKSILEPGREIITYTTEHDLARKIKLYLENENKRLEITHNAINKINSKYLSKHLCERIIAKLIL